MRAHAINNFVQEFGIDVLYTLDHPDICHRILFLLTFQTDGIIYEWAKGIILICPVVCCAAIKRDVHMHQRPVQAELLDQGNIPVFLHG